MASSAGALLIRHTAVQRRLRLGAVVCVVQEDAQYAAKENNLEALYIVRWSDGPADGGR